MKQQITISKKKLSAEINKAFVAMESAKRNYVFSVISLGEKLLEAREAVGFGEWGGFVKANQEFAFDERQAQKYMRVAKHKDLVISLFGSQELRPSLNQLTKAISAPKPAAHSPLNTEDDEIIDRLMIDPSRPIGRGNDDVIEAEFTAVAPQAADTPTAGMPSAPAAPPEAVEDDSDYYDIEPEDWEPEPNEDQSADIPAELERLRARNAWMESIFEDDNHTVAAIREIEKLKTINDALQNRLDAVVAENGQLQGRLNYWEARCKKLEKSNGK